MRKAFLVWNNEDDARDSLAAVNAAYGCPYLAKNGYRMARWDFVEESNSNDAYGFYKPGASLGILLALGTGFIEHQKKPVEFYSEATDEN